MVHFDENSFIEILKGRFDHTPKNGSKVVRIFLSSTFTDTHAERDYLIEFIYPKLRSYCKLQYALDFQVIDMRWGISDEATENHMATNICLNEIKNSQDVSIGPDFVALLSHRYGNRDLPSRIPVDEFKILKEEMSTNPDIDISFSYKCDIFDLEKEDIIEYCYQLDENEIPYRNILKNINKLIKNYEQKNPVYGDAWELLQKKLSSLFRSAAESCFKKGKIDETQRNMYFISITEKEVYNGILNAYDANNNCICFIRDIENISNKETIDKNPKLAARFIDLCEKNEIDLEAKTFLDELKYQRVNKALAQSNIHKHKVQWDSVHGISRDTHKGYLEQFGNQFYSSVKELIDRNANKPHFLDKFSHKDRQLLQEVMIHANFCNETVKKFHGRKDFIEKLHDYIIGKTQLPMIVYGDSGCGKTSILAKFSKELLKLVPDPQNYTIILRFLGTTPNTSNMINVYQSLIHQLSRLFDSKVLDKRLETKTEIKDYLLEQFEVLSTKYPEKTIVILLDSIDQLSTADYNIDWIISKLPSNVKMIYSTLTDHGDILKRFKQIDGLDESYFMEVGSLTKPIAIKILSDLLANKNRSLSEIQWKILDTLFENAKLHPLYVKLIFDITVKWASYHNPSNDFMICKKIDDCIKFLFTMLEKNHGKVLFSRCMFYLSSFKNGISENELEDILSIDDDVLYEVFEYHAPPIRRFPAALWARIKHDLSEYIVEKEADETRVIYLYHRRFIEVAHSIYISKYTEAERENVFSNVVNFFNETWKDKPKPFIYNQRLVKKKNLASEKAEACRNTAIQPTRYVTEDGVSRYNKRKLTELPEFISLLTPGLSMPLSCKHVYFNYDFSHGMFSCCNYRDIFERMEKIDHMSTYSINQECESCYRELKFLNYVYLQCMISISDYPNTMALQLLSRTLMFYGDLKSFTDYIDQCDKLSSKHCALVAAYQCLPPPSIGAMFTLEKHNKPLMCTITDDHNFFTLSDKIHSLNIDQLKSNGEIELPKLSDTDRYKFMAVYCSTEIKENSLNLKLINGHAVVISDHRMVCVKFDSTINFTKVFNDVKIDKMIQIGSNHALLSFENTNYIELYNVFTGVLVFHKIFESEVKLIEFNLQKERLLQSFVDVVFVVVLKKSEINVFNVTFSKAKALDKQNNDVSLNLLKSLSEIGIECISCVSMTVRGSYADIYDDSIVNDFCLSFNDGSYGILNVNENEVKLAFYKPKISGGMQLKMKLLDYRNNVYLFLNEDQYLFMAYADEAMLRVAGSYNDGRIIDEWSIVGVSNGILDFYKLANDEGDFKLILMMQLDAHFMDLTFLHIHDGDIFTSSKDSTFKLFKLGMSYRSEFNFKLNQSANEIKRIFKIDSKHFGTYDYKSPLLSIWNVSNGKILDIIDTRFEFIYDLEYKNGICCVIGGVTYEENKHVEIHSYKLKIKNDKLSYKSSSEFVFKECNRASFIKSKKIESIFKVIKKTIDQEKPIKFDILSYNVENNNWTINTTDNFNNSLELKFEELVDVDNFDNVVLTDQNQLLTVFYKNELYYLDSSNSVIMAKKCFRDENSVSNYFIKGITLSNRTQISFCSIINRNAFIAINKSNQLVYVDYEFDTKNIQIYMNPLDETQFSRIELFKHIFCAYSDIKSELYVYDLTNFIQKDAFKHPVLKQDFSNGCLQYVCVSDDSEYLATISQPRLLSLYRLTDGKRIAQVPLYNEVNCISMSEQFVVMGMQDKRLFCYLIVDPLKPDHQNRIMGLDSRNPEKHLTIRQKKTNDLIINRVNATIRDENQGDEFEHNVFDDLSEDSDITESDEELHSKPLQITHEPVNDEINMKRVRKKLRRKYKENMQMLDKYDINKFEINSGDESFEEPKWLMNLYLKNSFITQKIALNVSDIQAGVKVSQSENDKIRFQSTGNNDLQSNKERIYSRMCNLM